MELDLRKLQLVEIEILKEFQRVCKKYNLKYYAIGGTCIGAVRHKGFIPWDDDIDVAMPLEDFMKLREISKKEFNYPFELIDYMDYGHEMLGFFKIQNCQTAFIEQSEINFSERYKGVFIDIMPIMGCPKDEKKKERLIKKLSFYRWMNNRVRNANIKEIRKIKRPLWLIVHLITKLKSRTYYLEKWEKTLKTYKFGKEYNVLFPWRIPLREPYSNVFPYKFFSEPIEFPFEDINIMLPKDYDGYLKMDFGDYMKLPPVEKRISCHATEIIDLKKSYKDYIKEVVK